MAKKTEQTNIAPPTSAWGSMVKDAKDLPERHPKLTFGPDKLWEGMTDILVLESTPRAITYDDPFAAEEGAQGTAYVFNVRIMGGNNPSVPNGSTRALFVPSDPEHGLTRGILAASKRNGGDLMGKTLRIECQNYDNKRFKTKTRGYNVSDVASSPSQAP